MAKREPGKIERIAADLRAKIENGTYAPGAKLPSVSELQAAHPGIAFQTARDVFRLLERDGLAFTQQGRGSYVTPFLGKITRDGTARYQPAARSEGGAHGAFEAELRRLGLRQKKADTDIGRARPPKAVAEAFGLHHSANAIYRHRVMRAGRPDASDPGFVVQVATSWFPVEVAGGTQIEEQDTGPGGSKSRLAELGYAQQQIRESIEVRFPTDSEAEALSIPTDRPVYEVVHHASTADGRVVEVAVHVMPVTIWRFSYTWELNTD